jgi:hypothetical protein
LPAPGLDNLMLDVRREELVNLLVAVADLDPLATRHRYPLNQVAGAERTSRAMVAHARPSQIALRPLLIANPHQHVISKSDFTPSLPAMRRRQSMGSTEGLPKLAPFLGSECPANESKLTSPYGQHVPR